MYGRFLNRAYRFFCFVWTALPYHISGFSLFQKPFRYFFNITQRCNVRCFYCCQKESREDLFVPDVSLKNVKEIITKLPSYALIILSGGEPLCHDNFLDIVREIHRQGKRQSLLTNGLLLTTEISQGLVDNKVLSIGISIDGNKDYYEKIKGAGNFDVLLHNIDTLLLLKKKTRSRYPLIDLKVTVFPENLKDVTDLYKLAIDRNLDTFTVSLPKKSDKQFSDKLGDVHLLDMPSSPRDYACESYDLDEVIASYTALTTISRRAKTGLRFYPQLRRPEDVRNYFISSEINTRYYPCREPWAGMVISAEGECYPCLSVATGNILDRSLSQILTSSANILFRKKLRQKNLFSLCDGCCYAKLKSIKK